MNSLCCAVFNEELAKFLGKKETDSDLEFYHRSFDGRILTFVFPKGFPEKINPLVQAVFLANVAIVLVDKIDSFFGETIIAMDLMEKTKGFLIVAESVDLRLLEKVIAGTTVESFEKISKEEILQKLSEIELQKTETPPVVDLDGMFNVRGIGTIGLGFVKSGKLKKFDSLKALPLEKDAVVKTIQIMDKDFNEAETNDRVGVSLKGIEVEEFSRGMVLSNDSSFMVSAKIALDFKKSPFFKKEFFEGMQLHLQCREQIVGCKISKIGKELEIETGKPVAFRKNESVLLIDLNSKLRIIGKGKIL